MKNDDSDNDSDDDDDDNDDDDNDDKKQKKSKENCFTRLMNRLRGQKVRNINGKFGF